MGDVRGNFDLEKAAIELEIEEMKLSLRRSDYRLMQLEDERARILENKEATEVNIATKEELLEGMDK